MRKPLRWGVVLALLLLGIAPMIPVGAQENAAKEKSDDAAFYHVRFRVKESEQQQVLNTREYSLYLREGRPGRVRTGNRIPIPSAQSPQFINVGLDLDCKIESAGEKVRLTVDLNLENVAGKADVTGGFETPITRRVFSSASAEIALGTPVTILSIDDATSPSRFELEVVVTRAD